MKKLLCFITVISVLLGSLAAVTTAEISTRSVCNADAGDASGDGKINISDVSLMLKHVARWSGLRIDLGKADTVSDGKVNVADVSVLLKYIAKWQTVRLGHNDSVTVTVKPTCKTTGETVLTCKACGSVVTVITSTVKCNYVREIIEKPFCQVTGLAKYTCTMCGDYYIESIPATGIHNYVEVERSNPTCGSGGYIRYQCQDCPYFNIETLPATGKHKFVNGKCTVCGSVEDKINTHEGAALEVLRLVNVERKKAGLSPLSYYHAGQNAGDIRAKELTKLFSHTRPNGSFCFSVLDEAGIHYSAVGENIAFGYSTPAEVVEGWMNSPGHRANILNENFTHLIVGINGTVGSNNVSWVQLFIGF